jgi:hypothetical protein
MTYRKRQSYGAKRKPEQGLFVMLDRYIMDCPAWRALSSHGKVAYLVLKKRYNGWNNGTIGLSTRDLAKELNMGNDTAARAISDLVSHGFVEVTADSNFDRKVGLAREFRLTEYPDNRPGMPLKPTKEFMQWQAEGQKKQNAVAPSGRTVAPVGPTRTPLVLSKS